MYWNGARLDGMYPASIPVDGMAMHIPQVSNFRNIDFGITACRSRVPPAQRLIDYLDDRAVQRDAPAGIKRNYRGRFRVRANGAIIQRERSEERRVGKERGRTRKA